jgi:hypothetical protein
MPTRIFSGPVHRWEVFDHVRLFSEITLPFWEAREYLMPVLYNAMTGRGQQREVSPAHIRKIRRAMSEGSFTPTPASANLSPNHRKRLQIEQGRFTLEVDSGDPLLQTDAGHRFEVLSAFLRDLQQQLAAATDEDKKTKLQRWIQQVRQAPITVTIYLDGDPQLDFLHLQLGKTVDSAHMLSLRLQQQAVGDPVVATAFEVARRLNKHEDSPWRGEIRFDSRGKARLPITTLCARGSSDIATSLVGLARVGVAFGVTDANQLAGLLVDIYCELVNHFGSDEDGPMVAGKPLAGLSAGGKKGQATMLVGVATCMAYRVLASSRQSLESNDIMRMVAAVEQTLNFPVAGNFSGPLKRATLGKFARQLYQDRDESTQNGVPLKLIDILSASTFNLTRLPTLEDCPSPPSSPWDQIEQQPSRAGWEVA